MSVVVEDTSCCPESHGEVEPLPPWRAPKLNSHSSLSSNAASAGKPERTEAQGSRLSAARESALDAEAGEASDIKNQRGKRRVAGRRSETRLHTDGGFFHYIEG